jgi:hypothetical protein
MKEENEPPKTITVKVEKKNVPLFVDRILCCEADRDYTLIYKFNKLFPDNQQLPLRASGRLCDIEKLIGSEDFIRIGRFWLANKAYYLDAFRRGRPGILLMQNDVKIDIPRDIADEIIAKFKGN